MSILRTLVLCLLTFGLASQACGGLIYSFDQSNYNVAPGATVDVQVSLKQIPPIVGDPADLTVDGLVSAGVRIMFNDPIPTDPAAVLSVTHIASNPAFDDSLFETIELVDGVSAGIVDGVDLLSPPLTGSSFLLGTFTFTAGLVPGEVTNISAVDFSSFDETVSGAFPFVVLDDLIVPANATITVTGGNPTAIPEPSSLSVLVVGLLATAWRWRPRPKSQAPRS